jgi:uncharacterized membrane protein YoaK (UPF0700 family)
MALRSETRMQSANSIVDVGTLTQDARHGPLPLLLVVLTVVTGLVDAVSYLKLGHVFVANMTGNVLFLGFAAADAAQFSVAVSLVAMVRFCWGPLLRAALGRARASIVADFSRSQPTLKFPLSVPRSLYRLRQPT